MFYVDVEESSLEKIVSIYKHRHYIFNDYTPEDNLRMYGSTINFFCEEGRLFAIEGLKRWEL